MSSQKLAWITGASTGIGAATALKLAEQGWQVAITARSKDKLDELAQSHDSLHSYPGDVTDTAAMESLVVQIEKEHGPINLAILNAGTYQPDTADTFSVDIFQKHMDINLTGVAKTLAPVLNTMLERKDGHIAIVASVAGYRGLPRSLSYGPSKAALINMTEALAIECLDKGIKVQLINPGFVKTPLTDQNDFDMPMIMEVEDAAEKLVQGLESNKFEITFPKMFSVLLKLIGKLPNRLYFKVVKKVTSK